MPIIKQVPTSPENTAKIEEFAAKIETLFLALYARWQDEQEYEDIAEYGARLARELPEGWRQVGMSKRPFGLKFTIGTEAEYLIYANSKAYGWKRTNFALPAKAKRVLIDTLLKGAGTHLAIDWYDYQRGSNFDKWPRELIKQAAEAAGFIEYKGGHPWVTDAGYQWALSQ